MVRPKVFLSREIFSDSVEKIVSESDADVWSSELPPSRDVMLKKVSGVSGILCLLTDQIDADLMDAAGAQLKVISQIAVGFENIDILEATRRGIAVGYTPDVLTQTTADATFALMMSAARRITEAERSVRAGKWKTWHPLHYLGQDIHGAKLGILGLGRIGIEVGKRAKGFDMEVIYNDLVRRKDIEALHSFTFVDQETLLSESDFVTVHTTLNQETYHLIGEQEFTKMKPSAVLVNAARGAVVDPKALYNALKNKQIAAAALDVTEPEPIDVDDPLLTLDNCIIVPHIASATVKTRREMSRIAAQNLLNGLRGDRLLSCVNPEVYQD